jgi:hypothetical protein
VESRSLETLDVLRIDFLEDKPKFFVDERAMFCKKIKRSTDQTKTWIVLVKFGCDGCAKFRNPREKVSLSQIFEE